MLITCVGRRVELIREIIKLYPNLHVTDCDISAPALYETKNNFISHKTYEVVELLNYCLINNIKWITSLIDPMIVNLSIDRNLFLNHGIRVFLSDYESIEKSFDKSKTQNIDDQLTVCPTTIQKDRCGSAGKGFEKIRQPLLDGAEWNVQAYYDYYTEDLISVFMQKKLLMRAGETERSISGWDEAIYDQLKILQWKGFKGNIDIDFIVSDKAWIIDINPRFGGGYMPAHYSGIDHIKLMINNINGEKNKKKNANYELDKMFMKYDTVRAI